MAPSTARWPMDKVSVMMVAMATWSPPGLGPDGKAPPVLAVGLLNASFNYERTCC